MSSTAAIKTENRSKSRLVSLLEKLKAGPYQPDDGGWDNPRRIENCKLMVANGFAAKTLPLAAVAVDLLAEHQPDGVRGNMYSGKQFTWTRLGVLPEHFDQFNIISLDPKKNDTRYKKIVKEHGSRCAEVEAIPAETLRCMVEDAILSHIPMDEWKRLQAVEAQEKETWNEVMAKMGGAK